MQERLSNAQPIGKPKVVHFVLIEFSSENTARRILHIIHEEKMEWDKAKEAGETGSDDEEPQSFRETMKNMVFQGISEILDEIEAASSHIASQALDHIHSK